MEVKFCGKNSLFATNLYSFVFKSVSFQTKTKITLKQEKIKQSNVQKRKDCTYLQNEKKVGIYAKFMNVFSLGAR